MKQLYHQEKHQELKQQIHKLHGALCYCGVPRLKAIVMHLESKLKNNVIDTIPTLLNRLDNEVKCLMEYWTARQLLSPLQKE